MQDFTRPPTTAQKMLGIALSLLLVLFFGGLVAILSSLPQPPLSGITVCVALFAASGFLFWRAAFTASRGLSPRGAVRLSKFLSVCGAAGCVFVTFTSSGSKRHLLLVSSLSLLGYGLAGLATRRR